MTCTECGTSFEPKPHSRPDTKFCKTRCRQRHYERTKYQTDPEWAEWKRRKSRREYAALTGLQIAAKQLRDRRAGALIRRSLRANRLREAREET